MRLKYFALKSGTGTKLFLLKMNQTWDQSLTVSACNNKMIQSLLFLTVRVFSARDKFFFSKKKKKQDDDQLHLTKFIQTKTLSTQLKSYQPHKTLTLLQFF